MRWLTVAEWEASGGKGFDEPATFVYVKHETFGGLRVLAQWCVVSQAWVEVEEDELMPYGWEVTHILEVSDPVTTMDNGVEN